jgi:hypothetical protein
VEGKWRLTAIEKATGGIAWEKPLAGPRLACLGLIDDSLICLIGRKVVCYRSSAGA